MIMRTIKALMVTLQSVQS